MDFLYFCKLNIIAMKRILFPGLLLILALTSCDRNVQGGRDTIALVKAIASDNSRYEHVLLSSFSKLPSSGDICLIGSPESCRLISESFLACDIAENARGRDWSDGLKDFAGEIFASVSDGRFSPYGAFVAEHGRDSLRDLAVRLAIAALDSKCSASIYDLDGNLVKTPAKVIILADPWLLGCGKFDIDTLFAMTSCTVPVLSPQDLLLDAALGGEKKYFNIGIVCDSLYLKDGVYGELFAAKAREYDILGARCFPSPATGTVDVLASFLEDYVQSGNTDTLDAVLIDDWSVDEDALRKEIAAMRDYNREEYMRYGKLLSPHFTVFTSSSITMKSCYSLLRERSLFTHRIAQPRSRSYTVAPRLDANGTQFLLIPSENVQD